MSLTSPWRGLFLGILLSASVAQARVRTVYTDDRAMTPIYLSMGQSTVLRFREKPTKVVIGNANYINAEFIENDIALQPLGIVTTNIFIYGEFHNYGLILKVGSRGIYDDLVTVRWKSSFEKRAHAVSRASQRLSVQKSNIAFMVGSLIGVKVHKIFKRQKFYTLDLMVQNLSKVKVDLSKMKVTLTRQKQTLSDQKTVLEKMQLSPQESCRVRVFVSLKKARGFTLNIKLDEKNGKVIIPSKKLR